MTGGGPVAAGQVWFGYGLGAWNGADVATAAESARLVGQTDRDGLDLFTVADHPYFGAKLDAYALVSFLLGQTGRISGAVTVTNLPTRPGAGADGHLAVRAIRRPDRAGHRGRRELGHDREPRRAPAGWRSRGACMEEAITLIRALSGGGGPVSFDGEFFHVSGLEPAGVPSPPVLTGGDGPKSLAVTGRVADGWVPSRASDWRSELYRESRPAHRRRRRGGGTGSGADRHRLQLRRRITAQPLAAARGEDGRWIGGSVRQWTDELTAAVLEHHAGGFIYRAPVTPRRTRPWPAGPGRLSRPSGRRSPRRAAPH